MIKDKKEVKKTFKEVFFHNFVIGTFVALYAIVSIISTIHVIDFFELSNPHWLAVSLAIAFEIGAAASLSSIIILGKVDKKLVWFLFILLTAMQAMGNTYYAFTNLENYKSWIDLFGLNDMDVISQKRILSIVSGAILPIVALGFIKSLVDYMKPEEEAEEKIEDNDQATEKVVEEKKELNELVFQKVEKEPEVIVEETHEDDYKIPMTEDPVEDKAVKMFKDEFNREVLSSKEEDGESTEEEPKKTSTKKTKEKPADTTIFEKELDALKEELEKEKTKTKFEKELDDIRQSVKSEKETNQALKIKREKNELNKAKDKENETKEDDKKTEKIKKDLGKTKKVKELKVKPMVKRNPNPSRPL